MADWPYSTTAWQCLRRAKLWASPLCHPCSLFGRPVPADTVDHVLAITAGGEAFPPLDGLMSMCGNCHRTKTNAVDRAGGKGVRIKGTSAEGLPVDPTHPFFSR